MANTIGLNNDEMKKLVKALKETGKWEAAKAALPGVDGAFLDSNFKAWAMKQAGLVTAPVPLKVEAKAKVDPLK